MATEEEGLGTYLKRIAGHILLRLADAAGDLSFRIRNSENTDVLTIDSDGDATVAGGVAIDGGVTIDGGLAVGGAVLYDGDLTVGLGGIHVMVDGDASWGEICCGANLKVGGGMYVGSATAAAHSKDIELEGGVHVNVAGDPVAGEVRTASDVRIGAGLHVGATDSDPYDDDVTVDGGAWVGRHADATAGNLGYTGTLISYKNSAEYEVAGAKPLTTKLTSTSWDGDSYATTAKTKIDLSAVFGAPAGIKMVYFAGAIRDSGAASSDCFILFGPDNTANSGVGADCHPVNDRWTRFSCWVPCDSAGDVYYQIQASSGTSFEIYLEIWGYVI